MPAIFHLLKTDEFAAIPCQTDTAYFYPVNAAHPLVSYAASLTPIGEAEAIAIEAAFKPVKARKRQFLIQPGFVAKHRYYVTKGSLRAYVIDDDGHEHTIQLAIEGWWISDYNSYMFQQPASMFVMAMENCELYRISYEDEQQLKAGYPRLETFFRIMGERAAAFMQRRITVSLMHSAEQRYNLFLERYPLMAARFPQYVVASYLGMSTEFLSKIRNKKLRKG